MPVVAVTRATLIGQDRNEPLTVGGGGGEDSVERAPVDLTRIHVRGHGALEGPEPDQGIGAEGREELVELCGGHVSAAAGVDTPISGDLIGVHPGEPVDLTIQSEMVPTGPDDAGGNRLTGCG